MTLKDNLQVAVNKQINIELNSSYAYLAMAGWFETTAFKGFARWMQRQCIEEQVHAMKLFRYVKDRIGVINLLPIKEPKKTFNAPLEAFTEALEMERNGTKCIHELYALSLKEADPETQERLHWFLQEQIHEEKSVQDMVDKIALADKFFDGYKKPAVILHLDAHASEQH